MKKVIPLILAIAMVFSIGSMTALADGPPTLVGEFYYSFDDTYYVATVVGMSLSSEELIKLTIPGTVNHDGITYTVTSIGENAFSNLNDINAVTIPSTVVSIGKCAFENCLNLQSITFAEGSQLKIICSDAFSNCISLNTIVLPETLQALGKGAFYNCSSLKNINLPDGLTSIEACTFCGCVGLSSIEIPQNVTVIKDYAFFRCTELKAVTFALGSKLQQIGLEAFCICTNMVNISFPEGLSEIDSCAFSGCYSLQEVTFNGKNITFGENVFDNYDLEQLPAIIYTASDSLSTIFYAGTRSEWDKVVEDSGINLTLSPENEKLTVVCTDDLAHIGDTSQVLPTS